MKKYAKKILLGLILLVTLFSLFVNLGVKRNEANALSKVTISNFTVNGLNIGINNNPYNAMFTAQFTVSSYENADIKGIGLVAYSNVSSPSSLNQQEVTTYAVNATKIFEFYKDFSITQNSETKTFSIDYSACKSINYTGQLQLFLCTVRGSRNVIEYYVGNLTVKEYELAPGLVVKDFISGTSANLRCNFLNSDLLNNCVGLCTDEARTNVCTTNTGAMISDNQTATDAFNNASKLYLKYTSNNVLVFLNEENTIIGVESAVIGTNALPTLSTDYSTSMYKYNQQIDNKYLSGLFNIQTNLVYYSGNLTPFNYTVDGIVALYPKYRGPQYRIRYNNTDCTNYLETYLEDRIPSGEEYKLDKNKFTRNGYTFMGWALEPNQPTATYTDEETIVLYKNENEIVNLYPVWEANTYNLTVDLNDGSEPIVFNFTTDETILFDINPTRVGYTFVQWDTVIPETMPANDLTIKAQWKINKHFVTFYIEEEGEVYKTFTYNYNDTINADLVPNPTRIGYNFLGWNTEIATTVPDSDLTYYGLWEKKRSSIIFHPEGGPDIDTITLDFGDAVTAPDDPVRVGYVFKGWDPAIPQNMPDKNVECWAVWEKVDYVITCKLNNGEDDVYYQFGIYEEIKGIVNPTRENYDFKGWDQEIPEIATGNLELNAIWEEKTYKIRINDVYDVDYYDYYFKYGTAIEIPNPTKYYYDFVSYTIALPTVMPGYDLETTALWIAHKYTISFDTDGGSEIEPLLVSYKGRFTLPDNPTKEGCTFVSWDKEVPSSVEEDITFKAIWKKNKYTLKFIVDEEVYKESSVEFGSSITAPENPEAIGYKFVKWDKEIPETMPANDVTITAVLNKLECKVNFYDKDGNIYSTVVYDYGDTAKSIEAPKIENYSFVGWYTSGNYVEKFDFTNTILTEDVDIYPYYKEADKVTNVSITVGDYKINVIGKNGIYTDINISANAVTNADIDKCDFTKDFYIDWSKTLDSVGKDSTSIGGIYTFTVIKDDTTYKVFDLPSTIEIQIPEELKNKTVRLFASEGDGYYEIENVKNENGKIKFDTDKLCEFAFFYTIDSKVEEKSGCNTTKIVEIFGIVAMTATALFIFRKRFSQN